MYVPDGSVQVGLVGEYVYVVPAPESLLTATVSGRLRRS